MFFRRDRGRNLTWLPQEYWKRVQRWYVCHANRSEILSERGRFGGVNWFRTAKNAEIPHEAAITEPVGVFLCGKRKESRK